MADKRNIKVKIAYKGTAYHGFQRQENSVAVQNVVEGVLSRLTAAPEQTREFMRMNTISHLIQNILSRAKTLSVE